MFLLLRKRSPKGTHKGTQSDAHSTIRATSQIYLRPFQSRNTIPDATFVVTHAPARPLTRKITLPLCI